MTIAINQEMLSFWSSGWRRQLLN